MRTSSVFLFVLALVVGVAGAAVLSAPATAETNPIKNFSATVRASGAPVAVGSPMTIDLAATFRGDEDQDDAWVVFIANFGGPGGIVSSSKMHGDVGQTFQFAATHTYTAPGTYAIKVGAYHGNASIFGGYKYSSTKTILVSVQCAGADPGPKKCGKGAFSPFTGKWTWLAGDFAGSLTLTQNPGTETASGTVKILKTGNVVFELPIAGKVAYTRAPTPSIGIVDGLRFKGKIATPEGKKTLTFILFTHPQAVDSYFGGNVLIEDTPYFPDGPARIDTLIRETEHRTTVLCTTLAAGKKEVSRGDLLAVTCALQSEGPVCLPAGAASGLVEVEGGTIVEQSISPVRCNFIPGETQVYLQLHALGAGKSSANGRAGVAFAVLVDDDASEVRITFSVAPANVPNVASVTVPPDRVLCVTVEQPAAK